MFSAVHIKSCRCRYPSSTSFLRVTAKTSRQRHTSSTVALWPNLAAERLYNVDTDWHCRRGSCRLADGMATRNIRQP